MSGIGRTNLLLFIVPSLIWGSTWYFIKWQLGSVDPLWSVIYRFSASSIILFTWCLIRKENLRFSIRNHFRMIQLGIFLFGFNYWFAYLAEQTLVSALIAIAFSSLVFFNIFFCRIFLGDQLRMKVLIGAAFGFSGTLVLYYKELVSIDNIGNRTFGIAAALCMTSVVLASLGNVISAANQRKCIPVLPSNAYGMLYGSILMLCLALTMDINPNFSRSYKYVFSLLYLVVFGSVIAFSSYLKLVGRIGADKAAYVLITIPVIAVIISIIFEEMTVNVLTFIGIGLILIGNCMILLTREGLGVKNN